jgi:hypothetical protein
VAGNAGGGLGATAGTRHHVFGSGTTTQLNATTTNNRVVTIFNNQLYVSSMTGTNLGLNTVGTGLSTTSGQTLTQLPGFPTTGNTSAYGSFGLDNPLNPFVGIDTFYVADDQAAAGGGGLQRWVFNGTIWNNTGSVAAGTNSLRGVTASVAGDTVTLFGTTNEASANRLVTITDVLTAAGGTFNPAGFTTLGTAPLNTAFRGVAFAPVPEPSSILAVCGVGFGAAAWLRRRLRKPTTRAEVFV